MIKAKEEELEKLKPKTQPVNDPRGKKDLIDLFGKEKSTLHNNLGIENALSLRDLDMAIHYVLDQLVPLESFAMDIISYFNLKSKDKASNNFFGVFQPLVDIVQLWQHESPSSKNQ